MRPLEHIVVAVDCHDMGTTHDIGTLGISPPGWHFWVSTAVTAIAMCLTVPLSHSWNLTWNKQKSDICHSTCRKPKIEDILCQKLMSHKYLMNAQQYPTLNFWNLHVLGDAPLWYNLHKGILSSRSHFLRVGRPKYRVPLLCCTSHPQARQKNKLKSTGFLPTTVWRAAKYN